MLKNGPKTLWKHSESDWTSPFSPRKTNKDHIRNTALCMAKKVENHFFANFKGFLGSEPTFLHYTPQLQNPQKCSKIIQKCRENIQRVTEHPLFHLVKKSWSYHEYRAFYDKKCKKLTFFAILVDFWIKIYVFGTIHPNFKILKNAQKWSKNVGKTFRERRTFPFSPRNKIMVVSWIPCFLWQKM